MLQTLLQRAASIGLALVVTLSVLGGIDQLAQPDTAHEMLAAQPTARA